MHSKALTSLRSFFRPILRFLGMSSSPPPEIEFPNDTVVQYWELALLQLYCSSGLEEGPRNRSRMKNLKVNSIRHYKEKRHVEHEYLIAEISDPDLKELRYLQIERTAQDPQASNTQDTTERSSPRHSVSTLSSQSSLGVLKNLPARDIVSTKAGLPTGDTLMDTLNCRDSEMILLDLAIAAKVVHDHSDKYQLLKRQCFWYADVIISILHKNIHGTTRESLSPEDEQNAEMERYDHSNGTFKRVPIYIPRLSLIEEIGNIFATYNSQIQSTVNLLNPSIFLLANHFNRSRKPQRLLRRNRKRRRECRKGWRRRRKGGRRNGKGRRERWKRRRERWKRRRER
jgi:hypothetical protein